MRVGQTGQCIERNVLTFPGREAAEETGEPRVLGQAQTLPERADVGAVQTLERACVDAVVDNRHRVRREARERRQRSRRRTGIDDDLIHCEAHRPFDDSQLHASEVFARENVMLIPDQGLAMQQLAERTKHERFLRVDEDYVEGSRTRGNCAYLPDDAGQHAQAVHRGRLPRNARHACVIDDLHARAHCL